MKLKPTDKHHLFWYKRDYSKGWSKKLHDYWYCAVEIPRDTLHRRIHYEISHIPNPQAASIKEVLEQLNFLEVEGAIDWDDDIEKRLIVLYTLFSCIEPDTAKALKKQLQVVCDYNKKAPP